MRTQLHARAFACVLVLFGLAVFCSAAVATSALATTYEDGVYSIEGSVLQAASDEKSMANEAFESYRVYVKGGTPQLRVSLEPVSVGAAKGYLGVIKHYPDYHGSAKPPASELPIAVKVIETHDVTDDFNNASTGTDATVKGKKYPKVIAMSASFDHAEIWAQVYTPFMEGIAKGSGTQYVRIHVDFASMQRTGDLPAESSDTQTAPAVAEDLSAYYKELGKAIVSANKKLEKTKVYTKASRKALKKVRNAAQKMYENRSAASGLEISKQTVALTKQIGKLVKVQKKTSSAKSSASTGTAGGSSEKLSMNNLAAGTYTITGHMVKADKATSSMADKGISHRIKMTVAGSGAKTLSLRFTSVAVNGKSSYLGRVKYYKAGYKATAAGPSGAVANAKVTAYVQGKNGKNLKDEYGTNYPAQVSVPLIAQAQNDGYVPLQFFVPVMEKIAAGNGTQSAYLKLDLASISAGDSSTAATPAATEPASTAAAGASGGSGKSGSVLAANTLDDEEDEDGSAAAPAGTLEEVDDSALASGSLSAQSALGGAGPNAAVDAAAAPKVQASATQKQPPLKDRVPALVGVPACMVAAAFGYSSLKKRRGERG